MPMRKRFGAHCSGENNCTVGSAGHDERFLNGGHQLSPGNTVGDESIIKGNSPEHGNQYHVDIEGRGKTFSADQCILSRTYITGQEQEPWSLILFFDELPVGVSPYLQKSWQGVFDLVDIPQPYHVSINAHWHWQVVLLRSINLTSLPTTMARAHREILTTTLFELKTLTRGMSSMEQTWSELKKTSNHMFRSGSLKRVSGVRSRQAKSVGDQRSCTAIWTRTRGFLTIRFCRFWERLTTSIILWRTWIKLAQYIRSVKRNTWRKFTR